MSTNGDSLGGSFDEDNLKAQEAVRDLAMVPTPRMTSCFVCNSKAMPVHEDGCWLGDMLAIQERARQWCRRNVTS